jgi:hypothetical protein
MWKNDGPHATPAGEFTDGNPARNVPASEVRAKWLNMVQRELIHLVEGAGLTLDANDAGQVLKAVEALVRRAPPLDGGLDEIQPVGPVFDEHLVAWEGDTGTQIKDAGRPITDLALVPWKRQRHQMIAVPGEPTFRSSGWGIPPVGSMFARAELRTEGAFVTFASENVTTGEVTGLETPHYRYVRPSWNPTLAGIFRTPSDTTQTRIWLGCVGGHIAPRTSPSGRAVAALRFEHGVDTGWATVTCGGGTGITVVQSQPQWTFAPNTVVRWRIELSAAGPVTFYVNDVPASQVHTTNVPNPQAWLGCVTQLVTKVQSIRDCGISTLVLEHD